MKVLFALNEMGTLDHAISLKRQIEAAGADVRYVLADDRLQVPNWATSDFPVEDKVALDEALNTSASYVAFWFQEPYQEKWPDEFLSLSGLGRSLYSGYGVPLTNWVKGNFGLPFFAECMFILAPSTFAKEMYETQGFRPTTVEFTGDPLLFSVHENLPTPITARGSTFLWASHWSDNWVDGSRGFSRWREAVHALHVFFEANPEQKLVIRGHPHLEQDTATDAHHYQKLVALQKLDNVSLSSNSMMDDIYSADALISDGVSILAYFGLTAKPIGFVSTDGEPPPFNAAGKEIASSLSQLGDERAINKWLEENSREPSTHHHQAEKTSKLVTQHFPLKTVSPGAQLVRFLLDNR